MEATTEIEVGLDDRGRTVVRRLRCEAPLLVRVIDGDAGGIELALVNGAAGPLGGDHLRLRLIVGCGARVAVRSVAASLAQPGPHGEPSSSEIDLVIGDHASLDWAPEPTVSIAGSDHRTTVRLVATGSATVRLREAVRLGRLDEQPGRLALRQRVTIGGVAVLDHETVFAPGAWSGPGAHGTGRDAWSLVHIGAELPSPCVAITEHSITSTVHLSECCALTVAIG